jgi:hypothetical protein
MVARAMVGGADEHIVETSRVVSGRFVTVGGDLDRAFVLVTDLMGEIMALSLAEASGTTQLLIDLIEVWDDSRDPCLARSVLLATRDLNPVCVSGVVLANNSMSSVSGLQMTDDVSNKVDSECC